MTNPELPTTEQGQLGQQEFNERYKGLVELYAEAMSSGNQPLADNIEQELTGLTNQNPDLTEVLHSAQAAEDYGQLS
ncbi:MAG TPA: hypothetical protein VNE40_01300 [Candidatus Dormibacteraeota bacterium]|nr:hypothetical protein [Candidatus Dormibacteraeota bacterium]